MMRRTLVAASLHSQRRYIRKTPNFVAGIGAFSVAASDRPSTRRVSAGSITPSSHSRALA